MGYPPQPLPEPLRGSETGSFAHHTVSVRLARIARRTLEENSFPRETVARIEDLIQELPNATIRPLEDSEAPDTVDWQNYLATYTGFSWLDIPWFFAEAYFYRRMLEATGYFSPGQGEGQDPFTYQKHTGLEDVEPGIVALVEDITSLEKSRKEEGSILTWLISSALWGNQVDLSIWPAGGSGGPRHASTRQAQEHLLVDNTSEVVTLIARFNNENRLDFLIDNAGFELVCDLLLSDYLLEQGLVKTVRLHVKPHPTFVSDAMIKDVIQTVAFLQKIPSRVVNAFATRLDAAIRQNRLQLNTHFFWTSPLPLWQMPAELYQELSAASLVISKGDANYRRSLGDLHWPFSKPIEEIAGYFPTHLLLLRTLKSEVVAGLQPGQAEQLANDDPKWMTNGRWGIIQFI